MLDVLLNPHEEQLNMLDQAKHAPSLDLTLVLVGTLCLPIRHLHDAGKRCPSVSMELRTAVGQPSSAEARHDILEGYILQLG